MPSSASASSSRLALIAVRARLASTCGSRCPAGMALIMSCAERVVSLLATDETLARADSSSFTRPLEAAGPLLDQPGPHPGVIPKIPDRLGWHERCPQQAHLGQPGQPHRIELAGLGPAGQALGLGRAVQLHRQPAPLQHEKPDPPVG
jgi:hypothetical protein